ncbi:MAG: AI-2E family transporter [Patescibacteria group bacterium]
MTKSLTKPFLLILVFLVIVGCYLVFKPFLTELLVSIILVSIFYRPYELLAKSFKGRKNLAALLMCLFLILVIVVPAVKGIAYAGEKSVIAYSQAVDFFDNHDINDVFKTETFSRSLLKNFDLIGFSEKNENIKSFALTTLKSSSNWIISGATFAVKGTADFIVSLLLIIMAMFFFFVDGKNMLQKIMYLSPLPNKYDKEIFQKFRAVSYTTFVSTFVTAIAQGAVGAIGFAVVGFPPFLAGVLVAILSLIPYIGSALFYIPVGFYYLLIGQVWQGVFVLIWGSLIIGTVDNIIRAYMIKGKAEVNPVFVLFSILGGIVMFGFWGVVLGPLIIALAVTIFHIYALEFCGDLEGCDPEDNDNKKKSKK